MGLTKEEIEDFKKSIEIQKEYNSKKNKYVSGVSTMLIGLLGLLIALKPDEIPQYNQKITYLIALILIALGVLASLVFLFSEVAYVKRSRDEMNKKLLSQYNPNIKTISIDAILRYEKLYRFCEKLTYICLILSMIALIWYYCLVEF